MPAQKAKGSFVVSKAVLAENAVCGSLASHQADCQASHVALAATETMLTPATTANANPQHSAMVMLMPSSGEGLQSSRIAISMSTIASRTGRWRRL